MMKFLPVAVISALVVFSAAVPVERDEEGSEELTLNDVNEALESLDLLELSATESQLYFIKKIKDAIKRGVNVEVRIRPASAQFDTQAGLSFEEVHDLAEADDSLEELSSRTTYGFFKEIRKGLKKVGRLVEKGVKKVLERGVSVTVPI